jgi:hypothetical protein
MYAKHVTMPSDCPATTFPLQVFTLLKNTVFQNQMHYTFDVHYYFIFLYHSMVTQSQLT